MEYCMTPPPPHKKVSLKIIGTIILIAIICLVIVVLVTGVFSASPQQKIPSQNIPPAIPTNSVVMPPTGALGSLVPVTIKGTNFSYGPSPSVWLEKTGERDITAIDAVVISQTQLACTFPLTASSISAGQWDVVVKNADEQSGSKIGEFTVVNEISPPLTWDWSVDGWKDWQHAASCAGITGTQTGSCQEYGPVMVNGHGEYGSTVTLDSIPTQSRVSKTFTASPGARWNSITFNGMLSSSSLPVARWMAIDVNGVRVFYANAAQTPPGNGQKFTVTQSFSPANSVNVRIYGGQDPTFGTSLYTIQFDSLTLS
jgi:hypothetical protein